MSAQRQQAQYLPPGLPLPYYARVDLAFLEGQYLGAATPGFVFQVSPPAGSVMLIPFALLTVVTDATVVNRTITVEYIDVTGAFLWRVPSPVTIPASQTVTITYLSGVGGTAATGNTMTIEGPDTIIREGDHLKFDAIGWQAGDQMTQLNFQRVVIPTGPAADGSVPAASPIVL